MVLFFRKGLSRVITILMLLMLILFAVFAFDKWNISFSEKILVESKDKNVLNANFKILSVSEGNLYLENLGGGTIKIESISIGSNDCGINQDVVSNYEVISVSSCISGLSEQVNEVVIVTDVGIFEKSVYLDLN